MNLKRAGLARRSGLTTTVRNAKVLASGRKRRARMGRMLHWFIGVMPMGIAIISSIICFGYAVQIVWANIINEENRMSLYGRESNYCNKVIEENTPKMLVWFVVTLITLVLGIWFSNWWFK